MKPFAAALFSLYPALFPVTSIAAEPQVYTGVISESMCGINHTSMGITPDPKCIVDCVKHGEGVRYVLVDEKSKAMYVLSDQQTPENFAARRVRVTGVLYPKTKILKVERIEGAR